MTPDILIGYGLGLFIIGAGLIAISVGLLFLSIAIHVIIDNFL